MYTGLRFKGIIKEEYREDIDTLINDKDCFRWGNLKHELFKEFNKVSRSSFIPFGSLSYMPDDWEVSTGEKDEYGFDILSATDGFNREFDKETGFLSFQCSLKDYENTIEYFLKNVLTKICEKSYHIEELYEEDSVSTLYKIENGELIELDYGIIYDYEYEWFSGEIIKNDIDILYKDFDFNDKK